MCYGPPPGSDPGLNADKGAPTLNPKAPSTAGAKVGTSGAVAGGGAALGAHLIPALAPILGPAAILAPLIGGLVGSLAHGKPKAPIQTPGTPTMDGSPSPSVPSISTPGGGPGVASSIASAGGTAIGGIAGLQDQKNKANAQEDIYQKLVAAMKSRNTPQPTGQAPGMPQELPFGQ